MKYDFDTNTVTVKFKEFQETEGARKLREYGRCFEVSSVTFSNKTGDFPQEVIGIRKKEEMNEIMALFIRVLSERKDWLQNGEGGNARIELSVFSDGERASEVRVKRALITPLSSGSEETYALSAKELPSLAKVFSIGERLYAVRADESFDSVNTFDSSLVAEKDLFEAHFRTMSEMIFYDFDLQRHAEWLRAIPDWIENGKKRLEEKEDLLSDTFLNLRDRSEKIDIDFFRRAGRIREELEKIQKDLPSEKRDFFPGSLLSARLHQLYYRFGLYPDGDETDLRDHLELVLCLSDKVRKRPLKLLEEIDRYLGPAPEEVEEEVYEDARDWLENEEPLSHIPVSGRVIVN